MGYRFNPPPNWPAQRPDWTPPPGWVPDPSWPPPPPGWTLWLPDNDTATSSPAAPNQPSPQRARHWFAARPTWVKILLVLLAIGLLPWLLIIGGLATAGIGIIGLQRGSVHRFKVANRASATAALILGLAGIGAGSALAAAVLAPGPAPKLATPTVAATPATFTAIPTATSSPPAPRRTTHPPTTRPPSTVASTRPASLCGAPTNPYGYNFCGRGGLVLDPPADICTYFDCIPNFWNGIGHMEECQDQTYSMSGGRSGSCSHHGGNLRAVYSGP